MNDEWKIKEELFGSLKPRPAPGGFVPTRQDLMRPLEGPQSVAHLLCEGCGLMPEVTDRWIQYAEENHGLVRPSDELQNYYIHVTRCIYCGDIHRNVEFRSINSVPDDKNSK